MIESRWYNGIGNNIRGEKNSIYKINNITTYILSYLMEKNISRNRYILSSLYNKEAR